MESEDFMNKLRCGAGVRGGAELLEAQDEILEIARKTAIDRIEARIDKGSETRYYKLAIKSLCAIVCVLTLACATMAVALYY